MYKISKKSCKISPTLHLLQYKTLKQYFLIITGYSGKLCLLLSNIFVKKYLNNCLIIYFLKNKILTKKNKKNVIGLLNLFIMLMLQNAQFGFWNIIKLNGVGFSFFFKKKMLCIEVGLSHELSVALPNLVLLTILGKKNSYLKCLSIINFYVNDYLAKLINLQRVNIYTNKGLFWYKKLYVKKLGKIKKI
jgi:ribosomal protein L6P/L9E